MNEPTPSREDKTSAVASSGDVSPRTLHTLERMDDRLHIVVAGLLLVMAVSVLLYACLLFASQLPEIASAWGAAGRDRKGGRSGVDPFIHSSLIFLSNLLFVIIVLEILQTILTYLKSHSIQAIIKDFLVVGILSIVRKLLLIGAESSLVGSKGTAFIQDAVGTVISIAGILMLIGGLILLRRAYGSENSKF